MFAYTFNSLFGKYFQENCNRITAQEKIQFDLFQTARYMYVAKMITELEILSGPFIKIRVIDSKIKDVQLMMSQHNKDVKIMNKLTLALGRLESLKTDMQLVNRNMFVRLYEFIHEDIFTDEDMHILNQQYSDGFSTMSGDAYTNVLHYTKNIFKDDDDGLGFDSNQKAYLEFMGVNESSLMKSYNDELDKSIMSECDEISKIVEDIKIPPKPKSGKPVDTNKMINNMSKKWLRSRIADKCVEIYKDKHKNYGQKDIDRYRQRVFEKLNGCNYVKTYQTYVEMYHNVKYTDEQVWRFIDSGVDKLTKH